MSCRVLVFVSRARLTPMEDACGLHFSLGRAEGYFAIYILDIKAGSWMLWSGVGWSGDTGKMILLTFGRET